MVSLERPWAAIRTILARITSRYGDVYLRTLDFNSCCSSFVRTTVNENEYLATLEDLEDCLIPSCGAGGRAAGDVC